MAGLAVTRILDPQLVQNALEKGTSAWQEGQGWVEGGGGGTDVCTLKAVPQCIQNADPGFTVPLQRGHNDPLGVPAGRAAVPHC